MFTKFLLLPFATANLTADQMVFLQDNARKHLRALVSLVMLVPLMVLGLAQAKPEILPVLVGGLAAPVFVTGAAWFVITFGVVPEQLLGVAMILTRRMFTAFLLSLTLCFIAVGWVCPWPLWLILAIVWWLTWSAAFLYDCVDGLKTGLEPALLENSRYGTKFFRRQLGEEGDKLS